MCFAICLQSRAKYRPQSAEYRPIHPADHRPTVNLFNVINLGFTGVFFRVSLDSEKRIFNEKMRKDAKRA